jgi:GTP-binding protein
MHGISAPARGCRQTLYSTASGAPVPSFAAPLYHRFIMALPVVAIVGRPNVGKSSLLNLLARQRVSIVDPRAGITRDRVSAVAEHGGRYLELIDTGGVGVVDDDHLEQHVERQIEIAIEQADAVIFVTDIHAGIAALDQRVAERLRRLRKPVVLVANKADDPRHAAQAAELIRLGYGEALPVSALEGHGRTDLMERLLRDLGETFQRDEPQEPIMKLAIVGKRNAGKSTLVNALAGEPRMIVSEVPGTTRDAVDVRFERDGRAFVAIDTAGVRKRRSMGDVDFYSYTRALASIRRADVVMHLIDATVPVSEVDLKLARSVLDHYKPVLLVVNKWDLVGEQASAEQYTEYLQRTLSMLPFAPVAFITARTRRKVEAAVDTALGLYRQAGTRVTTGTLNRAVRQILAARGPSAARGVKPVRIYYATQIETHPPTIVCFCNDPALVSDNYRRYMESRLREALPFREVPIRLVFRARLRSGEPSPEVEVSDDAD